MRDSSTFIPLANRSDLHDLLNLFSQGAPRYTSYPPANYLHSDFTGGDWLKLLSDFQKASNSQTTKEIALYLHIPFCKTLCFFCACNRVVTKNREVIAPYLAALHHELALYGELFKGETSLNQLHLGGGTPNYLNPEELITLISHVRRNFPVNENFSFSIELDPRTCTPEHIRVLGELGCNRISIGVQDFDPFIQKKINRIQSFEETQLLLDEAKLSGIPTTAIDLIYGLPFQSRDSFAKSVGQVISLRPNRVAVYGYAHVENMAPGQQAFSFGDLPDSHERLDLLLDAKEQFLSAGYKHLGIDHFVLEDDPLWSAHENGTLGRTFMGYVANRGIPVLGCGASAISIFAGALAQNIKSVKEYQDHSLLNTLPVERGVYRCIEDKVAGALIEEILTTGRVFLPPLLREFGAPLENAYTTAISKISTYHQLGLLNFEKDGFRLTESGQLFGRQVAKAFDHRLVPSPSITQTSVI